MKKLILVAMLAIGFAATSKAQEQPKKSTISYADLKNNMGKVVTLCDTVYDVRVFSDTLTLINMGGKYPNQKFTIAVKGNKVQLDWADLKKKHLCVTGVLQLFKNSPEIVASEPNEITVSK